MNPVPLRAPGFDGAERRIGNAARRAIVAGAAARQVSSTFQTGALQSGTIAGHSPIFRHIEVTTGIKRGGNAIKEVKMRPNP